jgi:hypothetical protein
LQALPDPLNKDVVVNSAALNQFIDTKSKIVRIRSWGRSGRTEARLDSVLDTSRHNFVYWNEF